MGGGGMEGREQSLRIGWPRRVSLAPREWGRKGLVASVCLPVWLSLSVCLSVPFVCLPACLSVCLSVLCVFTYQCTCLVSVRFFFPVCPSVSPPVRLFVCLSVCLSVLPVCLYSLINCPFVLSQSVRLPACLFACYSECLCLSECVLKVWSKDQTVILSSAALPTCLPKPSFVLFKQFTSSDPERTHTHTHAHTHSHARTHSYTLCCCFICGHVTHGLQQNVLAVRVSRDRCPRSPVLFSTVPKRPSSCVATRSLVPLHYGGNTAVLVIVWAPQPPPPNCHSAVNLKPCKFNHRPCCHQDLHPRPPVHRGGLAPAPRPGTGTRFHTSHQLRCPPAVGYPRTLKFFAVTASASLRTGVKKTVLLGFLCTCIARHFQRLVRVVGYPRT